MRPDLLRGVALPNHGGVVRAAVQARHRTYGLPPPIAGRNAFATWIKSISTIMGRPLLLKLPIHRRGAVIAKLL